MVKAIKKCRQTSTLPYAQDHLMTSMTTKDLAIEIVELHEKTPRN
ncbi:PTS lactose/cellobiose transporter subunit IIA [Peribacillus simplex]